jgi:hypothetical protein
MEDYNYWITVYAVIFTILIASLSINSIFLIKDKVNKVLSFFVFSGLYALIISYFFEKASIGYTQQELLPMFIYKGYKSHLFYGGIYFLFSVVIFIILIFRIALTRNKNKIH